MRSGPQLCKRAAYVLLLVDLGLGDDFGPFGDVITQLLRQFGRRGAFRLDAQIKQLLE